MKPEYTDKFSVACLRKRCHNFLDCARVSVIEQFNVFLRLKPELALLPIPVRPAGRPSGGYAASEYDTQE